MVSQTQGSWRREISVMVSDCWRPCCLVSVVCCKQQKVKGREGGGGRGRGGEKGGGALWLSK